MVTEPTNNFWYFDVFRGRLFPTEQVLPTNNQFLPSHSEESETPQNGANLDGLA
jgi:hypothetical protein